MSREFIPPTECPVCGEEVPRGAKACPGCGADERTGWNEEATRYDGLDLPDEAYEENSSSGRAERPWLRNFAIIFAIILILIAFVFN
tara:strand:+ start:129 stop:389 length:261 start_codon:yes stop_codon:yes gene_type:complete